MSGFVGDDGNAAIPPQLRQYPAHSFWMQQEQTWLLVSGLLTRFLLAYLVTAVAEL
jgi:hypothetical protein